MLDIAEQMFASDSWESVHVGAIAEAADVSIGTVYTHFGNKDGLYLAVAERALEHVKTYVVSRVAQHESALDRISATGDAYLDVLLARPFLVKFLVTDTVSLDDPEVRGRIGVHVQGLYDGLGREIDAAIANGETGPVDSRLLARYLIGSWAGVIAMSMHSASTAIDIDELTMCLEQARTLLTRGLPSAGSHGQA